MLKHKFCSECWASKWEYIKYITLFWIIMLKLDIRFIPIHRAEGIHYYGIYVFELFGIYFLARLLQSCFCGKLENRFIVMLKWLLVFILYYAGLFCVRVLTGNNCADSLMVFRSVFWICICVVYFLHRGKWEKELYSCYIGMVVLQGAELFFYMMDGYWRNIFGLPSVLIALSPFMIPAGWMVLDAYRFKFHSACWVFIGSFFSVAIIIISGARIGLLMLLVSLVGGFCIVGFKVNAKQAYKVMVGYLVMLSFFACFVCISDMGGARNSMIRATGGLIYSPIVALLENDDKEGIIWALVTEYDEHFRRFFEILPEEKQGVLFHNPTGISDVYRALAIRMALDELSGDWMFHLQGDTLLHIPTGDVVSVSGAHNAVLDYCLAFGACGVAIIFSMWFYWLFQFWEIRHNIAMEEWWAVMLILLGILLNGMFQAMFNNFHNLVLPVLLLAVVDLKNQEKYLSQE